MPFRCCRFEQRVHQNKPAPRRSRAAWNSAVLTMIWPKYWDRRRSVVSVHWQSKYRDFTHLVLLHFHVNNNLGGRFCRLRYLLAAALASAVVYWPGGHCSSAKEEKICVHQHQLHCKQTKGWGTIKISNSDSWAQISVCANVDEGGEKQLQDFFILCCIVRTCNLTPCTVQHEASWAPNVHLFIWASSEKEASTFTPGMCTRTAFLPALEQLGLMASPPLHPIPPGGGFEPPNPPSHTHTHKSPTQARKMCSAENEALQRWRSLQRVGEKRRRCSFFRN